MLIFVIMEFQLSKYIGIHPGKIIAREFRKKNIAQRPVALAIGMAPQSLNQILHAKRPLPVNSALKIEKLLDFQEGSLALLQTFYDIEIYKQKQNLQLKPDLSLLRKGLFWDTDENTINWEKQYKAVVKRIFERGNISEKKEMIRFYGIDKVRQSLSGKI